MNGYLTTCINYRKEGGCLTEHTNGGKYDNILQFTKEAELIIRGLSYGVDPLYYNAIDNE